MDKNKKYQKKYHKTYYQRNKEAIKKRRKKGWKKYYKKHRLNLIKKAMERYYTPNGRLSAYKKGAKTRKLKFTLTLEEFKMYWKKPCSYCGDEIETIGLDRIDNNKGYIKDNIISCCRECNTIKRAMTQKDFINKIRKIAKNTKAFFV